MIYQQRKDVSEIIAKTTADIGVYKPVLEIGVTLQVVSNKFTEYIKNFG